jgi:transposase
LLGRRPYKVATVAFAAKTARIIWAMLVKGEPYRNRASAPAAAYEGDSRRARAHSVRKGNQGVMANGQETGIDLG